MSNNQLEVKEARTGVLKLEEAIKQQDGYDFEGLNLCKITHHFAPGVYAREMFIPKDVLITGKIHKTEHLNILSQGKLSISNVGEQMTVEAPFTYVSPIGTKRAIYAHEDSTWTTIHVTEETDLDALEAETIAEDFGEIDGILARKDYQLFLSDCSVTEDDVQKMTHKSQELEASDVDVLPSQIEGLGVFVSRRVLAGEVIAKAKANGNKTVAGRYCNHSGNPNAKMVVVDDQEINLVAIKDIEDEEVTTNYRDNIFAQGAET